MKLQKSPIPNSCVPTAFAMVLNIPIEQIIKELGHKGDKIIWPNLPEPSNRCGFHIQELVDICIEHGYLVTHIEAIPTSVPYKGTKDADEYIVYFNEARLLKHITNSKGVIFGPTHAVAWSGDKIYDPKSKIYNLSECDFEITDYYRIDKMI